MANICDNVAKISFNENDLDEVIRTKIISDFQEEFEYSYFDINYQDKNVVELSFGSRWSMPDEDKLKEFCTLNDVTIIGVSYDFSNDYVTHFEIL